MLQDETGLPKDDVKKVMFDMISDALLKKNVQLECHPCKGKNFFMFNEFTGHTITANDTYVQHLPLVTIICHNCGCIIQHAVNTLVPGLIKVSDEVVADETIEDKVDMSQFEETTPIKEEPPSRSQKTKTRKKYSL